MPKDDSMDLASRYEILGTIASGDFATVLRARDRELGREVAVKQIHQQYLADQQQLARYWREAQLLASLQHPNILTIYDVVRPRGWLILELMQGSLKERAQGEPLDLDSLRIVLAAGLSALEFLHSNGVIHGDVKPGNLLYDAQNRIKLGDFGLARRASSEEGSLLKGTTKYMAPELVSDQFGPVGPASDLYALGFSAYELMCGAQFESLFPGLATFGRDKQIAWMMWHAAPDRKLPSIGKVLEGVPEDLARVIEKLVVKDQRRRYQSAQEVLHDLTAGPPVGDRMGEEEDTEATAARIAAAKKKRRLRLAVIGALACSVLLSLAILFSGGEKPPPRVPRGVIARVFPDDWKLTLASSDGGETQEILLKRHDRFFINGEPARLRDLKRDDLVVVKRVRDETLGRIVTEVHATRPKTYSGRITAIGEPKQDDQQPRILTVAPIDSSGEELVVSVPEGTEILLNGRKETASRPVVPADLKVGDRVEVRHVGADSGRKAIQLTALRVVEATGVVCRDVAGDEDPLRVELKEGENRAVRVFPFAEDCKVTINEQTFKAPTDLRQGDRVTFEHDTQVVRVRAYRTLRDTGIVEKVQADRLLVTLQGQDQPRTYLIGPKCRLTLSGEPAELADLRDGDRIEIVHDSLERVDPQAIQVSAVRPPDAARWAILVGIQDYTDASLTRLAYTVADATLLRDTLVNRYWVPREQALLLSDETLARLKARIPQQLGKIPAEGTLLLYLACHAYQDEKRAVYLAPKDFQLTRLTATGLPLQWVLDELEKCPAGEKLLLLDCSHAGNGADLSGQPSTAEMIRTLKGPPGWAPLRTVNALASCSLGQRGRVWEEKGHGLFAWSLAQGYAGAADKERDHRIGPTELLVYLKQRMSSVAKQLRVAQTPVLLEADNRPPRLDQDAKREIRKLAEHLQHKRIDFEAVEQQYAAAAACTGAEPEAKLLYGLLLLKGRRRADARTQFAELAFQHPTWLIPRQGTVWAWFEERGYTTGLRELKELAGKIPKLDGADPQVADQIHRLVPWVGQLRQFAEIAAEKGFRVPADSLAELDAAVAAHGGQVPALYEQGRQQSRDRKQKIERDAEQANQAHDLATATQLLTVERYLLQNYAAFPFDEALKQIAAGLDQRVPRY